MVQTTAPATVTNIGAAGSRKANAEDGCKGRFWESRFTTQALLDETAVLACMTYVDLNPIRAGLADRPENSDFTSLQERLGIVPEADRTEDTQDASEELVPAKLMPFAGAINEHTQNTALPYTFADYLELVDWTGRAVRDDKRGHIPADLSPVLQRLDVAPDQWLKATTGMERHFFYAIGPVANLEQFCQRQHKRWLHGTRACKAFYSHTAA